MTWNADATRFRFLDVTCGRIRGTAPNPQAFEPKRYRDQRDEACAIHRTRRPRDYRWSVGCVTARSEDGDWVARRFQSSTTGPDLTLMDFRNGFTAEAEPD